MVETRKIVTILFADVTGSTRLGEELDAEALRRVMERYFEEVRAVLERHGGTVEKFIGDAVMAAFGIPIAHEDDAVRAVRAAVEMRGRLADLNEELRSERGVTLAVRTGINTGEVVAGDPVAGQFYASGDAVNVAARLEQAAKPGEIMLGELTCQLVRDSVSVEALEPLTLRGKYEAVAAYRLVELVEGAPALARRFDTPFVGREEERVRLLTLFEKALEKRAPTLVTVLGPAGIGKTRLAAEFTREIEERASVLQGRCLSYGEGITFWPLQEILRNLPDRPAGAPDPEQARSVEETFWAYRKLFEALAQERSLVLVLEDVHWAQPTLLDLVEHLVAWTHDGAMLIVCLARPEFLDERPSWPGEGLDLEPLPEYASKTIAEALVPELDPGFRARAAEAAEGNPLFLEQLLALSAEDVHEVALPHTIQGLLTARLDRLDMDERALLERAAVIGKEFWRDALVHLSAPETEVSALLQGLVRKRLVHPERSSFPGEDAFRFGHMLIRDATYGGIAKETRADLHEGFADWLAASSSPYDEIIGYHIEQAYLCRMELGPPNEATRVLADRAGQHFEHAGRRAVAAGDVSSAINLFERARALLSDSSRRLSVAVELADALEQVGELESARALFGETIELATLRHDERNRWLAELGYAKLGERLAPEKWMPRTKVTAERARDVFDDLGDELGLARAETLLSLSLWNSGHFDEATKHYRRSLAHARRAGAAREEQFALHGVFASMYLGTSPIDDVRREIEASMEQVVPGWRGGVLLRLACLAAMEGSRDEAQKLYREAKEIAAEMGLNMAGAALYTEEVGLLVGDAAFAERELRVAYEELEEMGDRGVRSTAAALLAEALYMLDRHAESEHFADLSLELTSPEDITSQARGRGVKAKLLAARNEYERAEHLAREAVELLANTDDLFQQSQVLMALADVLEAAGRSEEAIPVLESSAEVSERKGNVVTARKARARVAALRAEARV
jgi:class 3 adenylate cyclase/tetratricopeptide (TPR) repeat protein